MTELLALPEWNAPPRSLDDWVVELDRAGFPPTIERESSQACWLEVAPLRLRVYALLEGRQVTALHIELTAPDPEPATTVLQGAAYCLGWTLHDDPDEEEDDVTDNDD